MKRKTFIKKLRAFTTEVHCLNKARGVGGYNPKYCIFTGRDFVLPKGYSYQELYDFVQELYDFVVRGWVVLGADFSKNERM